MQIIKKEIKECEFTDGKKTYVLDLEFTHRGTTGRILIKDYKDEFFDDYLKNLRKEVRKAYKEGKLKKV